MIAFLEIGNLLVLSTVETEGHLGVKVYNKLTHFSKFIFIVYIYYESYVKSALYFKQNKN